MDLDCPLCRVNYDTKQHFPMVLCSQQHLCCEQCAEKLLKNAWKQNCPQCRQRLIPQKIVRFRLFYHIQEIIRRQKQLLFEQQQQRRKQASFFDRQKAKCNELLTKYREIITKLIEYNQNFNKQYFQAVKFEAQKYMEGEHYEISALLLQNTIMKYSDENEFIGIGLRRQIPQKGCSLDEYKKKYNTASLSAEDMLAFIYLKNPGQDAQKRSYQRILQKDPNNYKILFGQSVIHHNSDNLSETINYYQRIITLKPDFAKACELAGECNRQLNELASKIYNRKISKNNYEYYLSTAKTFSKYRQHNHAIQMYKRCLKLKPSNFQVYSLIAQSYFKLKKYEQALDIYQNIVTESFSAQIYSKIIEIYKANNDLAHQFEWLNKWLQIQPDSIKVKAYLADYYYEMKDFMNSWRFYLACTNQTYCKEQQWPNVIQIRTKLQQKLERRSIAISKIVKSIYK